MTIDTFIRDIPDWPKPGVVFKDITPLLRDSAALKTAVDLMVEPFADQQIDLVVGAESRGFIFGTAVAQALKAGFVPVRKPGKLPYTTRHIDYELEYGSDRLEIHTDAVQPGQRVLMVDDLLATGGTMEACCQLVRQMGGQIMGVALLIELTFLPGRARLTDYGQVHAVLRY